MKKMLKRGLGLLLAVSLIAGLAACGSTAGTPGSSPTGTAPTSTATPGPSGEPGGHVKNLVVGTSSQPETTSIVSQQGSLGKFNYNSITYANLFYPNKDNEMQPYFLKSYKISDDARELEMTFPTTSIWHDGTPVTTDDFVFTFEYRRDVWKTSSLKNLTEVRVNGEDSVTLVFSQPDAYFFVKNSYLTMFLLPKHIWEGVEDYAAYAGEDAAIGNGPYRLVSVDQDAATMYFEAVPENAYLGELTVDSITLKSYSSQDALLMALANGEIDLMYDYAAPVNYTLLDVIAGNENVDPGQSGFTGNNQVTFGISKGPNTVYAFREAAVKSLDWELLRQVCNGEYGEIPGSGIIPPSNAGADTSLWKLYQDVEEAKGLLDGAGFVDADGDGFRDMPDGSKFTYKVTAQVAKAKQEVLNRIGEILVASLRDVGVDAYFDQASLASEEANKLMVTENDYDMFIGYTTSGVANYRTAMWYFLPRSVAGSGGRDWGNSYNDEALNNAYISLQKAVNNDEYLKAVGELQQLASKDLFAFAVCWEKCFFPYRTDRFDGLDNYPSVGVIHAETFYNITEK